MAALVTSPISTRIRADASFVTCVLAPYEQQAQS